MDETCRDCVLDLLGRAVPTTCAKHVNWRSIRIHNSEKKIKNMIGADIRFCSNLEAKK